MLSGGDPGLTAPFSVMSISVFGLNCAFMVAVSGLARLPDLMLIVAVSELTCLVAARVIALAGASCPCAAFRWLGEVLPQPTSAARSTAPGRATSRDPWALRLGWLA